LNAAFAAYRVTAEGPELSFERRYDRPCEQVWRALTESAQLRKWFPADLLGTLEEGATIRIVSWSGRFEPADGTVTAYEANRVLEYTWGDERLRWELRANSGCGLTFTNLLDDRASRIGIAAIAAAWHACLDGLDALLSDESPTFDAEHRAGELVEQYIARLLIANRRPDSESST